MTVFKADEVVVKKMAFPACRVCGKKRGRVVSDFQTLNMFNRLRSGKIKTKGDIKTELNVSVDRLVANLEADGVVCKPCQNKEVAE